MMLETKDLAYSIGSYSIFSGVSLAVDSGERLAIIGESGSGKTTLLNCLGGLLRPTSGTVLFQDDDLFRDRRGLPRRFWCDHAAFIYQDGGVIDEESVLYNVMLRKHGVHARDKEAARSALSQVGLSGRDGDRASVLSGGEKQRLGIARALYKNADIMFADEPTASLDEANRELVSDLLEEAARGGVCVVLATHDLDLARRCDSVIKLGD